eukprot:CAMPEP_0195287438 /NCGR_PEP_ID=MMETSP0707-20130614/4498_1 /TAXON_ID=33640 /ORGANISM="Asterionellopsis glacialis, Strain CCMP134" /LENGTH=366 /DNA_ID=CAMNT_0040347191 /DNA_START=327 /DNA_END=1427 /DNA_ORIENTATION=+
MSGQISWNASSSSTGNDLSVVSSAAYDELVTFVTRELRLDNGEHGSFNRRAVVAILSVLLCIAGGFLVYNIWPFVSFYIRSKMPDDPKRVQRRYETIEAWVISKPVAPHADTCICGKSLEQELTREMNNDHNSAEDSLDEDKECPICFEEFAVGDKVAWSISGECHHVFHMDCIKSWLLRHTECPCCRRMYMPVDHETSDLTQKDLQAMAKIRLRRYQSTHYCVEGGLICTDTIMAKANDHQCQNCNNPKRLSTKLSATIDSFSTEQDSCVTDEDLERYDVDDANDEEEGRSMASNEEIRGDITKNGENEVGHLSADIDEQGTDEESSCTSKETEREFVTTECTDVTDNDNNDRYDVEMGVDIHDD